MRAGGGGGVDGMGPGDASGSGMPSCGNRSGCDRVGRVRARTRRIEVGIGAGGAEVDETHFWGFFFYVWEGGGGEGLEF